jgi:hypothetical protein
MIRTLKEHIDKIFAALVLLTASQLSYIWLERHGYAALFITAYSIDGRPNAYRVLIPFCSRVLEAISGQDAVTCMMVLVSFSAVGLYYSVRYLYTSFKNENHADIIALIACEITILPVMFYIKVYDLATAMFFTISFAALARKKYGLYYLIFPIATLNRETTILLTLFFATYLYRKMPTKSWIWGLLYQITAFLIVKSFVDIQFAHLPGSSFIWSWRLVVQAYASNYLLTSLLISVICLLVYLSLRRWQDKPHLLVSAFLFTFSSLVILHLLFGMAFEVRVFSEILPVATILALYPIRPYIYETAPDPLPKRRFVRRLRYFLTNH